MKLRALLALVLSVAASALLSGGATAGKACDLIPTVQAAQESGKKPEKCPPKKKKVTLSGTVKDGNTGKPVRRAIVTAGGQSKRTDAKGAYRIKLDQGDYAVRPSEDPKCADAKPPAGLACGAFDPRSRNVSLQEDRAGIDFKMFKRDLKVEVIPDPPDVILEELDEGFKPEKVPVEVRVTNLTKDPVTANLPKDLTIGVTGQDTKPIRQTKGPSPKTLDLAPRKPKSAKYTLEVEKKGEFEIEALVLAESAADSSRTLRGLGSADLKADSGLQVKVQFVRRVEVPGSPGEFTDELLDSSLAEPFGVNLEDHPDKEKTETVPIRVTVRNKQPDAVERIRLDDLKINWKVEGVEEPAVLPLKQTSGPKEPVIAKLEPGESAERDYVLEVSGDGTYEIVGTAKGNGTGSAKGKTIPGKGRAYLHSRTPLLFFYAKVDRTVRSPDAPRLQTAGTAFSIRIRLQNRSFTEKVIVDPFYAKLSGNAFDGHIQEAGLPIQVGSKILDPEAAQSNGYVLLEPNNGKSGGKDERLLDAVVRTKASDPTAAGAPPTGGTRALVEFTKPKVRTYKPPPKGFDGPGKLTLITDLDKIVFAEGADSHSLSVDDSVPQPPPVDFLGAVAHFTYGATLGLANSFTGAVQGLLDLPHLLIQGSYSIWQAYVERQAELWTAVISEPDLLSAYRKLQEKNAEFMIRDLKTLKGIFPKIKGAFDAANKATEKKFTGIANNWYHGDWTKAAQDMGELAGQTVGDLALADAAMARALAIVPRIAKAAKVVDRAKLAENKTIRAVVETFNQGVRRPTAARVIKFLSGKVKPGYIFAFEELADLYGMTHNQAVYLAGLCKKNGILISVRSRAVESLAWIKKGAYVKPEFIKLKNVNHYDIQYLGYAEKNMGRVVIRRNIPTEVEVIAALDRNGVTDAATRKAVLERRADRVKELESDKPGLVKELTRYASTGEEVPTKFNWQDNGLDPAGARANKTTNVKYRTTPDPPGSGDLVLEVSPEGGKGFNSITGDNDIVGITNANGTALSPAEHLRMLEELRGPPMYIQHPESVTWNKDGSFDFEQKHFELTKDDPVQFGPDGQARKVRYVRSRSTFTSNTQYTVAWDGGYRYTGREGPLTQNLRILATGPVAPSTSTQPGGISYWSGRRYATGAGAAVFAGR